MIHWQTPNITSYHGPAHLIGINGLHRGWVLLGSFIQMIRGLCRCLAWKQVAREDLFTKAAVPQLLASHSEEAVTCGFAFPFC